MGGDRALDRSGVRVDLVRADDALPGADGRVDLDDVVDSQPGLRLVLGLAERLELGLGETGLQRLLEVVAEREALADPLRLQVRPREDAVGASDLDAEDVRPRLEVAGKPVARGGRDGDAAVPDHVRPLGHRSCTA